VFAVDPHAVGLPVLPLVVVLEEDAAVDVDVGDRARGADRHLPALEDLHALADHGTVALGLFLTSLFLGVPLRLKRSSLTLRLLLELAPGDEVLCHPGVRSEVGVDGGRRGAAVALGEEVGAVLVREASLQRDVVAGLQKLVDGAGVERAIEVLRDLAADVDEGIDAVGATHVGVVQRVRVVAGGMVIADFDHAAGVRDLFTRDLVLYVPEHRGDCHGSILPCRGFTCTFPVEKCFQQERITLRV